MSHSCDALGVCQQRTPACCNCNEGRACPVRLAPLTTWVPVAARPAPIALQGPFKRTPLWQRIGRAVRW